MDIGKITLSEKELFEAVQSWLASKGLRVEVASVQKAAFRGNNWEVTSVVEEDAKPAPRPASNRELGICVESACTNKATGTGDTDHDHYYCNQHKKFCDAQDCIVRISADELFCNAHKDQPAPPVTPVELPKESPF